MTRKLLAEFIATALLLAIVIGSGIMAQRLSGGNDAIALLANTLATVGGLYVLIEVFGPVSGAHMNPAVTSVMRFAGNCRGRRCPAMCLRSCWALPVAPGWRMRCSICRSSNSQPARVPAWGSGSRKWWRPPAFCW